jgi:hypothetical protein
MEVGQGPNVGCSAKGKKNTTQKPITVAARSIFACLNAGIVGSNPTQSMDICVCVYSVFVFVLCLGRGLATG